MNTLPYADPEYRGLVEGGVPAGVLADWLDDHGRHGHAAHLRAGGPLAALADYDWRQAFGYAGEPDTEAGGGNRPAATPPGSPVWDGPFGVLDVRRLHASQEGDRDGPEWLAVGGLWDGRFFALRAGCDYTGWD
jgi:hypothetical protein